MWTEEKFMNAMQVSQMTPEEIRKLWCIEFDFELQHINTQECVEVNQIKLVQYENEKTVSRALVAGFDSEVYLGAFGIYALYKQLRRTPVGEIPSHFRVRQLPSRRFIAGGTLLARTDSEKYVLAFSFIGDDLNIIPPIALSRLNTKEHYFLVVKKEGSA